MCSDQPIDYFFTPMYLFIIAQPIRWHVCSHVVTSGPSTFQKLPKAV